MGAIPKPLEPKGRNDAKLISGLQRAVDFLLPLASVLIAKAGPPNFQVQVELRSGNEGLDGPEYGASPMPSMHPR